MLYVPHPECWLLLVIPVFSILYHFIQSAGCVLCASDLLFSMLNVHIGE